MVAIFDFSKWRLFKVCYVFFTFFRGESENYTFLERLRPTDYENRCWHFFNYFMAAILDFQNGRRCISDLFISQLLNTIET